MRAMPNNVAKVWCRLDKIWRSRIFGGGQVGLSQADLVKSVSKHNLCRKRFPGIVDSVKQRGQSLALIGLLVVEIWRRRWSSPLNQRCCCSPTACPTATKLLPQALSTMPNNVAIVWYLYRHCRWRHHRASPRRHTPVAPRSPTPPVTAATA